MKHTATAPPTCPSRRRGGRRFAMNYHRGDTLVAQRTYAYDQLGRPNARTITRQGSTRTDAYTYNNRSELIGDVVDGTALNGWDYDRAAVDFEIEAADIPKMQQSVSRGGLINLHTLIVDQGELHERQGEVRYVKVGFEGIPADILEHYT